MQAAFVSTIEPKQAAVLPSNSSRAVLRSRTPLTEERTRVISEETSVGIGVDIGLEVGPATKGSIGTSFKYGRRITNECSISELTTSSTLEECTVVWITQLNEHIIKRYPDVCKYGLTKRYQLVFAGPLRMGLQVNVKVNGKHFSDAALVDTEIGGCCGWFRSFRSMREYEGAVMFNIHNLADRLVIRSPDEEVIPGGIKAVVSTMLSAPDQPKIQRNAALYLAQLASIADNIKPIARAGGISAIVAAMNALPDNEEVQHHACLALTNLAMDASNKKSIVECGGISSIMKCMKTLPASENVQHHACWALANLTAHKNSISIAVPSEEPIDVVIAAMKAFPGCEGVQRRACQSLANFAMIVENRSYIVDKEGISVIVAAMTTLPSRVQVQRQACLALANLSSDNVGIHAIIDSQSGAVEAIENAMKLIPVSDSNDACAGLRLLCGQNTTSK